MATRMQQLAQPKPDKLRYPDRRSVYWLDKLPPERTASITKIVSPTWEVSERALRAVPSKRLCSLAQPRAPVAGWRPDHLLLAPLSRGSQTAVASSRICQLAQPKRGQVQEGSSCRPADKLLPTTHWTSKASAHTELLATPKHDHPKFEGGRSVCWPVSRAARKYVATQNLLDLSGPKERKALFEGYDPYMVSRAARSATPTPRIKELCLPLPRKCSSK
ncbi:sperm microtubule associated protein 2-like [Odontesthes bonariensis]|uniref:sperm microtubule associated protein 2-like n=1 Tax=Odontesthes bonariensis TaxID=219752 RepID=UPI003F58FB43